MVLHVHAIPGVWWPQFRDVVSPHRHDDADDHHTFLERVRKARSYFPQANVETGGFILERLKNDRKSLEINDCVASNEACKQRRLLYPLKKKNHSVMQT
jgi:5-deoxy-D-glucuronate isomerase